MGIHLSTATARTLQDKRAVKLNEYYNMDIGYSQAAYLWITDRLFSPVFHYTGAFRHFSTISLTIFQGPDQGFHLGSLFRR